MPRLLCNKKKVNTIRCFLWPTGPSFPFVLQRLAGRGHLRRCSGTLGCPAAQEAALAPAVPGAAVSWKRTSCSLWLPSDKRFHEASGCFRHLQGVTFCAGSHSVEKVDGLQCSQREAEPAPMLSSFFSLFLCAGSMDELRPFWGLGA